MLITLNILCMKLHFLFLLFVSILQCKATNVLPSQLILLPQSYRNSTNLFPSPVAWPYCLSIALYQDQLHNQSAPHSLTSAEPFKFCVTSICDDCLYCTVTTMFQTFATPICYWQMCLLISSFFLIFIYAYIFPVVCYFVLLWFCSSLIYCRYQRYRSFWTMVWRVPKLRREVDVQMWTAAPNMFNIETLKRNMNTFQVKTKCNLFKFKYLAHTFYFIWQKYGQNYYNFAK
jgi:hypothetical protein